MQTPDAKAEANTDATTTTMPSTRRPRSVRRFALNGAVLLLTTAIGVLVTVLSVGSLLPTGTLLVLAIALLAFRKRLGWGILIAAGLCLAVLVWRASLTPRNDRAWQEPTSRLPGLRVEAGTLIVEDLRDFSWHADGSHTPEWTTRSFPLANLRGVDLILEPFSLSGLMAHTMLSFDFGDAGRLLLSIEARKEEGESYNALRGGLNTYELINVFTTERDALTLRARRGYELIAYPTATDPLWRQAFLLSLAATANNLHEHPRFYHIIRDNCTTAWIHQADQLNPDPIGFRFASVFNGLIDQLLIDRGIIDTDLDRQSARAAFKIDHLVLEAADDRDGSHFSSHIRTDRPPGASIHEKP